MQTLGVGYLSVTERLAGPFLLVCLTMSNPKPFVAVACLVETIVIEPNEVPTLVRIIDTFHVVIPPNVPPDIKPSFVLNAFVSLKGGPALGDHEVSLRLRPPSGEPRLLGPFPIHFESEIHGVNMKLQIDLQGLQLEATYWIDVLWTAEKEVLTSIPFRFKKAEVSTGGPVGPKTPAKQTNA